MPLRIIRRDRWMVVLVACVLSTSALAACSAETGVREVSLYYYPEQSFEQVVQRCNEQAAGDYRITYHRLPREADGQREQMVRRLAAEDTGMDRGTVRALRTLRNAATAGVTSSSLANSAEDQIRRAYERGNGAFQLNWPYVYPSMQQGALRVAEQTKWERYPATVPGQEARVPIGGSDLAVSSYSTKPELAFRAALCLRSKRSQTFSALNSGVPPTIEDVYSAPEMADAYPMRDAILAELKTASVRPKTPAYQNVSTLVSSTISPPSQIESQATADELRSKLQAALDSKGILP